MFLLWHPSLTAINLSYTFPILETSATALCGTTGIFTSKESKDERVSKRLQKGRLGSLKNIAPQNGWLEDHFRRSFHFGMASWQVRTLSFRECTRISWNPKMMHQLKVWKFPFQLWDFCFVSILVFVGDIFQMQLLCLGYGPSQNVGHPHQKQLKSPLDSTPCGWPTLPSWLQNFFASLLTPWKINGWNLQITYLERKMIWTEPPWLCSSR